MPMIDLCGVDVIYGSLMTTDNRLGFLEGFNDNEEFASFIRHSKDKHTLLDIGSSYGAFGLHFAKSQPWKEAYCFDGSFTAWLALNQTILLNDLRNINSYKMLLGDRDGVVGVAYDAHQSLINQQSTNVEIMMQVDSVCEIFNIEPDCMKIDTEGFEYKILRGAIKTIEAHRPTLFMEVHPKFLTYHDNDIYDVLGLFNELEYIAVDLQGNEIADYKTALEEETTDSHRTVWVPKGEVL